MTKTTNEQQRSKTTRFNKNNKIKHGLLFFVSHEPCVSQDLDMGEFEDLFKTKAQGPAVDLTLSRQKLPQKVVSKISLLEANRAKNLAITLRKAGQGSDIICRSIQT